jgi:hypothetical protein
VQEIREVIRREEQRQVLPAGDHHRPSMRASV